jgi:hypothetical protein
MFCAIDARWIAPRWPVASLAWFALAMAGALVFAWHYYAVIGPQDWRRAWYRFTGDPRIEDFPTERAIDPLGRMVSRWKFIVRLAHGRVECPVIDGIGHRIVSLRWEKSIRAAEQRKEPGQKLPSNARLSRRPF